MTTKRSASDIELLIQKDYVVPDIETIVEIDGALRDAVGLIEAMRLLLESAPGQCSSETFAQAAGDIAWITLEKIVGAREKMEAPEKQATAEASP
jgi:hypothetical protein